MRPSVIRIDSRGVETWLDEHFAEVETELLRAGALLLRGLDLSELAQFRSIARRMCGPLLSANGEHVAVDDAGDVQTPVEFSAAKKLLWHNENTFNLHWPSRLLFGCVIRAEQGGDTPTVDGRRVADALPAGIRAEFARDGLTYIRRLGLEVGLDWRTVYGTADRAQVERQCRESATTFEWSADGEQLTTWQTRPAIMRHPVTGESSWVGQPLHWHPAALPGTLRQDLTLLYGDAGLPRDCVLGSGDPIPDQVIDELVGIYTEQEDVVPWQAGDVLWVDNLLRAHARDPFVGKRKLLVALGAPVDCRQLATETDRSSREEVVM